MDTIKTVLIIDDDPDDREFFCEALGEVDPSIRCLTAENGEDGLALLKSKKDGLPHVIFLDMNMPRLNGKQCLAEIKKIKELCHIPVVIYTTTRQEDDAEELHELGAALFLTKPSSFKAIQEISEK